MSDDESDNDTDIVLKEEMSDVQAMLSSMDIVVVELIKTLNEKHRISSPAGKVLVDKCLTSTTTLAHILSISISKSKQIHEKIVNVTEEMEEIEQTQENHVFELNNLEAIIKTHKDDKKVLVPLTITTTPYSINMLKNRGGESQCSTCLTDFKEGAILAQLQCGHYFHEQCALKWLTENKSVCSLCKQHIVPLLPYKIDCLSSLNINLNCGRKRRTNTLRDDGDASDSTELNS